MVRFALLVMNNICKHAQCVFILPCFHVQVFSLLSGHDQSLSVADTMSNLERFQATQMQ